MKTVFRIVKSYTSHLAPSPSGEFRFLDPDVAAILAQPAAKEAELLDALTALGGDESVAKAAAVYARACEALADAYDGRLPDDVRKAMGVDAPRRKPAPEPIPITKEAPVPTTPKRTLDETLAELRRVKKQNERYFDAHAEADLEAAAERIRKASGYQMTKPQSMAKALEEHPDLYAGYHRDKMRKQGVLDDHPNTIAKAEDAQARLDRAADAVLAREPSLTREQAVVKALEADPSLYGKLA